MVDSGTDLDSLLQPDPPTAWTLTDSLLEVNGPISTPAGDWFTTSANIGGMTRQPLPAGQTLMATLSVTVTGVPGTYHLMLSDGFFIDEAMTSGPMIAESDLGIIVQGQ